MFFFQVKKAELNCLDGTQINIKKKIKFILIVL